VDELQPKYVLNVSLTAAATGSLILIESPSDTLTALLTPVLQGPPGPPGPGLQLETAQW
jgi:hypothetical protein